jgi:hypothetical protein
VNLSYIHRDLTACKSLSVNKNGCSQYNLFDKLHFLQRLRNEKDITIFRERILHISSGRTCIIRRYQREYCLSDPCKVRGHIGLNLKISGSTFFFKNQPLRVPVKDNNVDRVPDEPGIRRSKRNTATGGQSVRRSCPSESKASGCGAGAAGII